MHSADEELTAIDPARHLDDESATRLVRAAWVRAASAGPSRSSRYDWRVFVPAGLAAVAVTTGAAIAAPVWLGINGVHVEPDAQIPVSYTTLSGVEVSCTWAVHIGDAERTPLEERVAEALAATDWDGVGQDIYDQAIANPRVPQPGETWAVDTQEVRDAISFKLAILPVMERRLPAELQGAASHWGSTDTCTGPFR
ncbi:hypothetical protein [Microbacterium trichothecenolyticum]|uniref:Uncharacterized protein n=1 Tax=Microbacterium trichothecenolyticum TaxID=69370 RepID=A0ABU0TPJ4_MICTR|nr:hypothetical protein [Microbacterium trichothecenolyticum]MDQ1121596.1 hypothetical protein [Microbacterium trichothecenolyticum]